MYALKKSVINIVEWDGPLEKLDDVAMMLVGEIM
jgi:hypothetical protein